AGAQHPAGVGLMVGADLAHGAAGLLFDQPRARLVLVERDVRTAELALAAFPLLAHYRASGRLTIAAEAPPGGRWDFGLCTAGGLTAIAAACDHVYVRCLGWYGGEQQAAARGLAALGRGPIRTLCGA